MALSKVPSKALSKAPSKTLSKVLSKALSEAVVAFLSLCGDVPRLGAAETPEAKIAQRPRTNASPKGSELWRTNYGTPRAQGAVLRFAHCPRRPGATPPRRLGLRL